MTVESYPLQWPAGWPRTTVRQYSAFKTSMNMAQYKLKENVRLLGGVSMVLSTNVPVRNDGMPYASFKGGGSKFDSGIAVYFSLKEKQMVFACDRYIKIEENVHAVGLTIEALRGIERWGASQMMERAFSGFAALPPAIELPRQERPWWEVLGFLEEPERWGTLGGMLRDRRNALLQREHPDKGGDEAAAAEINRAYAQGVAFMTEPGR